MTPPPPTDRKRRKLEIKISVTLSDYDNPKDFADLQAKPTDNSTLNEKPKPNNFRNSILTNPYVVAGLSGFFFLGLTLLII